jgi:UPF0755 protein
MVRRKILWTVLGTFVLTVATTVLASWFVWRDLHTPLHLPPEGAWLEVAPGTPLFRVADELNERGIVRYPQLLRLHARLSGDATRIRAGEYQLAPGLTPVTLLDKLVRGDVFLHSLTIVEGSRFSEMLAQLRRHPAIVATDLTPEDIMAALGKPDVHPEGQFFPDTYRFARGTTDLNLLRQAHAALDRILFEAWDNRSDLSVLEHPYEALILASIIEKETGLASERREISGVFHRRLQLGMRLQTDPTVIYGLGEDFQDRLRSADLTRDTPYNTYTRFGLPPTPIALSGRAAIEAAVNPLDGEVLYFVATGLPDGSHYFSITLEEHNRAVQRYLERRRSVTQGNPQ